MSLRFCRTACWASWCSASVAAVAILHVRLGQGEAFEAAFAKAQAITTAISGYLGHELQRCLEVEDQYVLLVHWRRVEDHEQGFRRFPQY